WIPISNLIDLASLTKVRVHLTGKANASAPGHSNTPANRPKVTVYSVNATGGSPGPSISALSSTVEDPVTDTEDYDEPHTIDVTLSSPESVNEADPIWYY